jgi:tetratricopeptide (TPR) repeat protein
MVEQDHINSLIASALRKHLDGDLEQAEKLYREILLASPDEAQTKHYLGYLLQQTDRLQEALEQLTAAIALDETHAEWHFNLGIVLLKQNQTTAAIDALSSALRLDQGKYFYWTNLGAAFELNQ